MDSPLGTSSQVNLPSGVTLREVPSCLSHRSGLGLLLLRGRSLRDHRLSVPVRAARWPSSIFSFFLFLFLFFEHFSKIIENRYSHQNFYVLYRAAALTATKMRK